MAVERYCPRCGEDQNFWRTASTTMHLGEKVKYSCAECGYGFVRIDDVVDTGAEA